MNNGTEKVLDDLQKVLGELEHVVKGAVASTGEQAGDVMERVRAALDKAQGRIEDAEQALGNNLRHGARAADEYVKGNVWTSIGVVAAIAFIAGIAMGRRR
jgi:ElaB protein